MKTKLLLFATVFTATSALAQIPNAGFETLTSDNNVSQWAKNYLLSISIDTTGEMHGDSVVFDHPDQQLYRSTTDAHSGQYAMEMTNGYNYTGNFSYVGGAFLASSDFYSALFPEMVYVDPIQPEEFSFYYKYFPEASDSAQATLLLYDGDGNTIAESVITLGGTTSAYILASAPIVYNTPGTAYAMSIMFATQTPGNQPTPGTRFLVDDVALSGNLSVNDEQLAELVIVPNPASSSFAFPALEVDAEVTAFTANGTRIAVSRKANGGIDCSSWAEGCYFVHVTSAEGSAIRKVIIAR